MSIYSITPDPGAERELINRVILDHMTSNVFLDLNINTTRRKVIKILNRNHFYFSFILFYIFPILSGLL